MYIAAKQNANFVWLNLSTAQNQILNIMEAVIFMVGLGLVRQFGLNFSWRKMIWMGSVSAFGESKRHVAKQVIRLILLVCLCHADARNIFQCLVLAHCL